MNNENNFMNGMFFGNNNYQNNQDYQSYQNTQDYQYNQYNQGYQSNQENFNGYYSQDYSVSQNYDQTNQNYNQANQNYNTEQHNNTYVINSSNSYDINSTQINNTPLNNTPFNSIPFDNIPINNDDFNNPNAYTINTNMNQDVYSNQNQQQEQMQYQDMNSQIDNQNLTYQINESNEINESNKINENNEEKNALIKKPKTIDEVLEIGYVSHAADIHITSGVAPKYRIMNELRPIPGYDVLDNEDIEKILRPILTDDQYKEFMDEGEIDFAYSVNGVGRFRCNLFKQRGTWAGVFRILNDRIPTPEELGIPACVKNLIHKKRGLVLVTGPTGSGKTTTLASLISEINANYKSNIITLEEPIEYLHKHMQSNINQREIGCDSKTFASALRAALREDPDVILVGEMRDFETMSIAISAAETGHLVFSTLHTIGAAETVNRIIDTYPTNQQNQARNQLAAVIEGIISQQLIPKADGSGRVAAFEILLGNTAIRKLIRDGNVEQIPGIIQNCKIDGMQLLDDHLVSLVKSNTISLENAVFFAQNVKTVKDNLLGGNADATV